MTQATYPDLRDRVALVTGGASGLGLACVRALASQGCIVYNADLNFAAASDVAASLQPPGIAVSLDVTSEESWQACIAAIDQGHHRLDILINSAGIIRMSDVENTTFADWRAVMSVNLDGVFLGCKHGLSLMRKTGGSIINLSSVSGIVGGANLAAYNASKGGVRLLTKSVALHCARKGYNVRCNSIHPSFAETPMAETIIAGSRNPQQLRGALEAQVPLGRFAEANEIADMALYLASDVSRFVTAAEFVIDGGLTSQ